MEHDWFHINTGIRKKDLQVNTLLKILSSFLPIISNDGLSSKFRQLQSFIVL